jgi:hypothetical protein
MMKTDKETRRQGDKETETLRDRGVLHRSVRLGLFLLVSLSPCLLVSSAGAAAPSVTYLYPAGGQRGTTIEVLAGGTFERWPVGCHLSGKGITAKALPHKGKLAVTMAADVTPGVYWLRLHDEQGASVPRPFVVGHLAEMQEKEPNDEPKAAQAIASLPVTVNGRLEKPGDVDGFAVRLTKGQTLVASLLANRVLGSPMDAVLQVVSEGGFVLAENNDYHDLDPQLTFTAPADGAYLVRTFAFPAAPDSSIRFAGGENYVYRLTLTTGPFAEYALPLAVPRENPGQVEPVGWNIPTELRKLSVDRATGPVWATATIFDPRLAQSVSVRLEPHPTVLKAPGKGPQPLTPPVTVSGRLERAEVHAFTFAVSQMGPVKKGQKFRLQVESRSLGFALDATLRLFDPGGALLSQVDDVKNARDPELSFTAAKEGTYRVELRDLHGEGGLAYAYRLRVVLSEPDYALTLATDRFVLTPGKPLDVPVTIDRRDGFAEAITLTADGLPEGVTAAPVQAAAAAKAATLRLTASKGPVSGAFRVLGSVAGKEEFTRTATATVTGLGATVEEMWLTVAGPAKK